MSGQAKAMRPEDVTRLVAERLNAGDAAGVAALYEPQAVLAYPADQPVTGREAIQAIYQQMADAGMKFAIETPLPTVRFEDLALTSTRSADNTGVRVQVLRRQPDGSWLRIIDRPEVPSHNRPAGRRLIHDASQDMTCGRGRDLDGQLPEVKPGTQTQTATPDPASPTRRSRGNLPRVIRRHRKGLRERAPSDRRCGAGGR